MRRTGIRCRKVRDFPVTCIVVSLFLDERLSKQRFFHSRPEWDKRTRNKTGVDCSPISWK
jgi:hypothetical protein